MVTRSYWLVNSNRSRVKRFIENTNNKDQFFKYMFIDSGKVEKNRGSLDKKRELELLFITSEFNNTLLITNSGAGSKSFSLFKLFLPKSKSINLAFLIANLL